VAKPKVILQLYPMLPAKDEADRKSKRPLGRDSELYNRVLHDWLDIVKECDRLGVWGASTIEHHLHSEGYEVGPNPGILNAWWAGHVKNVNVGALGYVMATQDPIRVAEETAILDHITNGKFFVGLARGYQSRWTNILGQFTDSQATVHEGDAADEVNRRIFEERVDMLLKCWTEDSVALNGTYYKAPYPFETGIAGYPAHKIAGEAGTEGEVDANGNIRRISVVPKPKQSPHPPVFVATSKSIDSVKYCARNGFNPVYFTPLDKLATATKVYVEEAAKHGRQMKLGQNQTICRWIHIGKTREDYRRKVMEYDYDIYKNFYAPFFPSFPTDPNLDWVKNIEDSGLYMGGTLEDLRAQFRDMYSKVPCEYITLIWHYAQAPKQEVIDELGTFMEKVLPDLEASV